MLKRQHFLRHKNIPKKTYWWAYRTSHIMNWKAAKMNLKVPQCTNCFETFIRKNTAWAPIRSSLENAWYQLLCTLMTSWRFLPVVNLLPHNRYLAQTSDVQFLLETDKSKYYTKFQILLNVIKKLKNISRRKYKNKNIHA